MLEELESSSIEDMALVFMVVGRFPCIHAVIDAKKKCIGPFSSTLDFQGEL